VIETGRRIYYYATATAGWIGGLELPILFSSVTPPPLCVTRLCFDHLCRRPLFGIRLNLLRDRNGMLKAPDVDG
jgi:hypothetical protein